MEAQLIAAELAAWRSTGQALLVRTAAALPSASTSAFALLTSIARLEQRLRAAAALGAIEGSPDMLRLVLRHLDPVSLCRAAQARRAWRDAADEDGLWQALCRERWPATAKLPASLPTQRHRQLLAALERAPAAGLRAPPRGWPPGAGDGAAAANGAALIRVSVDGTDLHSAVLLPCAAAAGAGGAAAAGADETRGVELSCGSMRPAVVRGVDSQGVVLDNPDILGHDWQDPRWCAFRRSFAVDVTALQVGGGGVGAFQLAQGLGGEELEMRDALDFAQIHDCDSPMFPLLPKSITDVHGRVQDGCWVLCLRTEEVQVGAGLYALEVFLVLGPHPGGRCELRSLAAITRER